MTYRPVISGRNYAIAAGHPLASMAGAEILASGGNAIDAGVGAGIAIAVLESTLVSFAGVAPIILHAAASGETVSISGVGSWPRAMTSDYFVQKHGGKMPPGILRTVVPAAPDAWITALERYGTMGFADVSAFAIEYAEQGFRMYPLMAELIANNLAQFGRYESNREVYLPGGEPPAVGSLFKQPALGRSIRHMADQDRAAARSGGRLAGLAAARHAFYAGDLAAEMIRFHREQESFLSAEDLRDFSVEVETPPSIRFGKGEVFGCGPWSQGPMLLQILQIMQRYDLRALGHNSVDYLHALFSAINSAAEDRDRYYGDPRFVDVPLDRLLSEEHAEQLRIRLGSADATADKSASLGQNLAQRASAMDTSYVCASDRHGNVFSATPSDAAYNAPVVPSLGFVVSARGQQSWTDPAHPSSVAPGKRPRLTPNPALAVLEGRLIPFGSPGGDVQTQAMAQVFLNHAVFGFDVQESIEQPRIASYSFPSSFEPHDSKPGLMMVEAPLEEATGGGLRALGHKVEPWPAFSWLAGSVSLISSDRETGNMNAGSDPRRMGYAVAR